MKNGFVSLKRLRNKEPIAPIFVVASAEVPMSSGKLCLSFFLLGIPKSSKMQKKEIPKRIDERHQNRM